MVDDETDKDEGVEVPEGYVLLDGRLVRRESLGFMLHAVHGNDRVLKAIDGTVYSRDATGALRRLNAKKKRKR